MGIDYTNLKNIRRKLLSSVRREAKPIFLRSRSGFFAQFSWLKDKWRSGLGFFPQFSRPKSKWRTGPSVVKERTSENS